MKICLNCGIENENWICEKCQNKVDIENLCNEINTYDPEENSNKIFESIINNITPYTFRYIVLELVKNIESPKKELLIIDSLTRCKKYYDVSRDKRSLFYSSANIYLNSVDISPTDKNYLLSVLFINNFKDYNYEETEKYANLIKDNPDLNRYILYELGLYYTYTRNL